MTGKNHNLVNTQNIEALYGDNTCLCEQKEESCIYQTTHSTGKGVVEKIELFPGIQLYNQNFTLSKLDYDNTEQRYPDDIIAINHCRFGRFEAEFPNGEFLYMGEGDLAVNLPENSPVRNGFPLGRFQGFTMILTVPFAKEGIHELESVFGVCPIDIEQLRDRLRKGNEFVLFRSSKELERILEWMYLEPSEGRLFSLRIKALELLCFLMTYDDRACEPRPYFHKNQVSTVKAIAGYLQKHVDRNFTLEELSVRFDISLSGMKKCFKAVYGMPVHAYLRQYRIHVAADLLRQTNLSVAEIAERVGYSNQSKFTGAFRQLMQLTPVEYRNLKS